MWDSMMGWGWHGGAWGPGWGAFGLMHVLWWVLIVAAIVVLIRGVRGRREPGAPGEDRALAILRERYARGEIDKTEFENRKRDLAA